MNVASRGEELPECEGIENGMRSGLSMCRKFGDSEDGEESRSPISLSLCLHPPVADNRGIKEEDDEANDEEDVENVVHVRAFAVVGNVYVHGAKSYI